MLKQLLFSHTVLILTACSVSPPRAPEAPAPVVAPPPNESVCTAGSCEGFIPVTGGKIWYRIVGVYKRKTPLLVLHGGPGATHDYLDVLESVGNERPVILYDQLGCGRSDRPDDRSLWTLDRYVEEVHQLREHLGLKRTNILGHGWGSMLAMEYYLRHPDGIESLVLSSPIINTGRFTADRQTLIRKLPPRENKAVEQALKKGEFLDQSYLDAVQVYNRRHLCRLSPWPDSLNRSIDRFNRSVFEELWGPADFAATGSLRNFNRTEELRRVSVPVLITCGEKDDSVPKTCAIYSELVPRPEIAIFSDGTRSHHLESPDAYIRVVRRFLMKSDLISRSAPGQPG